MILIMIYTNDKPNRSNLFNVYVFFDTHLAVINPRLTFHYTNVRLLLESKEENIHPVKVPDTRRLVERRRLSRLVLPRERSRNEASFPLEISSYV